jgi:hypothetical protein
LNSVLLPTFGRPTMATTGREDMPRVYRPHGHDPDAACGAAVVDQ